MVSRWCHSKRETLDRPLRRGLHYTNIRRLPTVLKAQTRLTVSFLESGRLQRSDLLHCKVSRLPVTHGTGGNMRMHAPASPVRLGNGAA